MKNVVGLVVVTLAMAGGVGGCASSGGQEQGELTCLPKQDLAKHQSWLEEISAHYCDKIYLNLAPPKREGAKEFIDVLNPEPALPNYAEYPDVHPTSAGVARVSKIARFMYKKCKALGDTKALACRGVQGTGCADPFFTFMMDRLDEVGKGMKAPPYLMDHVVKDAAALYTQQTQKKPQLCEGGEGLAREPGLTKNSVLHLSLGMPADACLNNDHCPGETVCSHMAAGRRCIPLPTPKAAPASEVTAEEADENLPLFNEQAMGQACMSSRECTKGTVCAGMLGNAPTCSKPCDASEDCGDGNICYRSGTEQGVCIAACKDDGGFCVETAMGRASLTLRRTDFTRRAGEQALKGAITEAALEAAMPKLSKAGACGNGVIDYPEACDAGADNGKPRFGGWCSKSCERMECGDGVLDAGESCECSISFAEAFYTKETFQERFQTEGFCPGRYAIADGSELATGFSCLSCTMKYIRIPKVDTRTGDDYMPREIPASFKAADGTPGFIWNTKRRKALWEKQQKEQEVKGMVEDLVTP